LGRTQPTPSPASLPALAPCPMASSTSTHRTTSTAILSSPASACTPVPLPCRLVDALREPGAPARRRSRSPGTTKSNPISIVSSPVVPTTQARDEVTPRVGSADHGALDEPRIQVTRTLRAVRQKLERRFYTPSASDSDDVHPEPEEEDALRKFFLLQHARAPQARAGPSQDESSEDDDDMLGGGYPNLDAPLQTNACVPSHGGPQSTFVAFIPLHFRFLRCALLIPGVWDRTKPAHTVDPA